MTSVTINPAPSTIYKWLRTKVRSAGNTSLSHGKACDPCASYSGFGGRIEWGSLVFACVGIVGLALMPSHRCSAQDFGHTDVLFEYGPEKIEINAGTFTSFFPTRGISRRFQTLPGFASETDVGQGILANDEIVYNVLSDLQFWADGALRPELISNTQIRVRNRPSVVPDTILSSRSGEQPGDLDPPRNRVGRASTSGNFHSDLQWFLETTEEGHYPPEGTYSIQLNLSTNRTALADSDPFYFIWHYGADSDDFYSAVAFFDALLSEPTMRGDFDGNGQMDAGDIDLLAAAIKNGTTSLEFDLNADQVVNSEDHLFWIVDLRKTFVGDTDLNGYFDEQDIVEGFIAGKYLSGKEAGWADGDWDGSLLFDDQDFVAAFVSGGYLAGPRSKIASVPEPNAFAIFGFGICCMVRLMRPSSSIVARLPQR